MPQPTHILLLRHGLTDANASGTLQGHQPTPLNALGHRQAQLLARRLATHTPPIELLISSDLPRAAQTAQPIARACGLALALTPAWRERCLGSLEGKTAHEQEIWRMASAEADPPGAESASAFIDRIHGALLAAAEDPPARTPIAIVTHGGPCRAVLRMLIDGRLPLAPNHPTPDLVMIANCSIMHLVHHAGTWQLASLNDAAHLHGLYSDRDAG